MADWVPNERFAADADWFKDYRLTDQFREEEVDYKAALQAVLRAALSEEALARPGLGAWIEALVDRKLSADQLGLSEAERALVERWNYKQSWVNLNGGAQGAAPILGALHAWAGSADDAEIRSTFGDLLRGSAGPSDRIERFITHLNERFKVLHDEHKLRSKTPPRMALTFAASILGLVDPERGTLWRAGEYRAAAQAFGFDLPGEGARPAEKYAASIAMQTAIRDALIARGVAVRNLLEVHDFLWVRAERIKAGEDTQWWIFQANPAMYDVDAALRHLPRIQWSVRQYVSQIMAGHRVFLYRTGKEAGIVATLTIETDPAFGLAPDPADTYDFEPVEADENHKHVWLRVDRVLTEPVTRAVLKADPILAELRNLKFPNASNYPVTPDQARRLRQLIDRRGQAVPPVTAVVPGVRAAAEERAPLARRRVADILRGAIEASGLWFEPWVADDLYMALRAKPFVILTGLSGTGKTKIAMALQRVLCDDDTAAFVAVRPDWVDSKSLLGYHNLLTDTFTATPATRLLLHAAEDYTTNGRQARPHVLLLDEMNLARVEHYLSDYLSVLESRVPGHAGAPLRLHDQVKDLPAAGDGTPIPQTVLLAPNVYVIGTVNIDETTHPFSRKVLDRANVVELFDVDLTKSGTSRPGGLADADRARLRSHFTRDGSFLAPDAPDLASPWLAELIAINGVLASDRLHFGYRVRNEILAFIGQAGDEGLLDGGADARRIAFDLQLLQKVLPKLAGSKERLWRPLVGLLERCLVPAARTNGRAAALAGHPERLYEALRSVQQPAPADGLPSAASPGATAPDAAAGRPGEATETAIVEVAVPAVDRPLEPGEVLYPRTARKIARMLLQLSDEGYTSFFE